MKFYSLKQLADEDRFSYDTEFEAIQSGFDNWKWMQFTGLIDKNGTDIYEGDIVNCMLHGGMHLVRYGQPYNAAFCLEDILLGIVDETDIEVIGSIHTHPHLIEKEKA
jgi:uncharacterized phage protein (TIGR01671 family)